MRKYEPYNPNGDPHKKIVLVTNRLFVISLTIYAFAILFFIFPIQLIISEHLFRGVLLTLISTAFCMNVVGFEKGIHERKMDKEMAINGIIGNLTLIIIILVLLGIGISYFYQFINTDFTIHLPIRNR